MTNTPKEFAEFEGMKVPESLKVGLGNAISQRVKEVARAHQDRQRQLAHASGNSDRCCGSLNDKIERLKAITITVSPLMPHKTTKKEITDEQKVILRNYRSWAWARKQGLIIKTGRGR